MKKIFISSVVSGFEEFRQAARKAVDLMGDRPIMCEDFGARPYSSETACITEAEASDVYVVILGSKYGFETEDGTSVTQAEFNAAKRAKKPILVFVQDVEMEERQQALKAEVEEYKSGLFRAAFSSPEDLKDEIVRALKQLEITRNASTEKEFLKVLKKAQNSVEDFLHHGNPELTISIWPQPLHHRDLNKAESELDGIFSQLCGAGLANLKDGYEEVTKKDHVGVKSGKNQHLLFENGLILFAFDPTVKREGTFFDASFVPPSRLHELCEGISRIVDINGAWCEIKLSGMDGKRVEELPPIGTSSMGYSMFGDEEAAFQRLLIPMTYDVLAEWLNYCVGRFERIFSK